MPSQLQYRQPHDSLIQAIHVGNVLRSCPIRDIVRTFACFILFEQFLYCRSVKRNQARSFCETTFLTASRQTPRIHFRILSPSCIAQEMRYASVNDHIGPACVETTLKIYVSNGWGKRSCGPLTEAILVWLASIKPLTRWLAATYGDFRVKATCIEAGPQGMKLASCLSRIRSSD
jgi:hypothetical protein